MASCFEFELLISQKLDDELSETEEALLTRHLQTCADCRTLYLDLVNLQKTLSSFSVLPPPNLHARIMDRIKEDTSVTAPVLSSSIHKRVFSRWLAAAAVLLFISGAVLSTQVNPFSQTDATLDNTETYSLSKEAEQRCLAPNAEPQPETESPMCATTSNAEKSSAKKDVAEQNGTHKILSQDNTSSKIEDPVDSQTPPTSEALSKSEETYDGAPPSMSQGLSDEKTLDSRTATLLPEGITWEEAEALLLKYLSVENSPAPQIVYQGLSSDGINYRFLYTDDTGKSCNYFVSLSDGAILCESTSDAFVH